jgi:TonB family protein
LELVTTLEQHSETSTRGFAVSAVLHIAAVAMLLQFGGTVLSPRVHRNATTLVFTPPQSERTVQPAPLLERRNFIVPKLAPPPVAAARRPVLIESPVIQVAPQPVDTRPAAGPTMPPPPAVTTHVLNRQAPAPVRVPPPVQVGGFSQAEPREATLTVRTAAPSGFDGTTGATTQAAERRVVSSAGFGESAAGAQPSGSSRAVVMAAGFGASAPGTNGHRRHVPVPAHSAFGDIAVVKPSAPNVRTQEPGTPSRTPVEITFKPRPTYTDEARRLQIEGEVLLEVVFTASGEVQVVRVIQSLGHGLTESAMAAARAIRFRPATRNGQPVDRTATVRMSFELAY